MFLRCIKLMFQKLQMMKFRITSQKGLRPAVVLTLLTCLKKLPVPKNMIRCADVTVSLTATLVQQGPMVG